MQLNELTISHEKNCLMLLGSPPDMVHNYPSHGTHPTTCWITRTLIDQAYFNIIIIQHLFKKCNSKFNYIFKWKENLNLEIKIAHCADIHIGAKNPSLYDNYKSESFINKAVFFNILEKCKAKKVDFLLVAGDLFDDVNIPACEIDEIKNELSKSNCNNSWKSRSFYSWFSL